jgi:hypothetical protein
LLTASVAVHLPIAGLPRHIVRIDNSTIIILVCLVGGRFCTSLCGDGVLGGGDLTVLYVNRFGLFPLPQTYALDIGV